MINNDEILIRHLKDLALRSYSSGIYTFSNFLNESEISSLRSIEKDISYAGVTLYGGAENAERCLVRFGSETLLGYDQEFPITCLKIEPLLMKFAEDFSHRDVLGALMSLQIERELTGDIYCREGRAYVFCIDRIAGYIIENLHQIKHTNVSVTEISPSDKEFPGPEFKEQQIIVSSERLDGIISKTFNLSRSQSQELFKSGKIFINGRICESPGAVCKAGDKISVRGFGKFIYTGSEGITKKGRLKASIHLLF